MYIIRLNILDQMVYFKEEYDCMDMIKCVKLTPDPLEALKFSTKPSDEFVGRLFTGWKYFSLEKGLSIDDDKAIREYLTDTARLSSNEVLSKINVDILKVEMKMCILDTISVAKTIV
ncbi:MAG: hypothetical protein ACRCXX_02050 [Cetobacterium sp.]|uniref:hypothetical protein n=1 Tax=Cetobacterium sp. TaxID=2071632 RepID=UPI003F3BF25A